MRKDSGWLNQQHSPRQLPDLNCTSPMPELGQKNIVKGCTNPHTCMLSASASLPGLAISESPHLKADQENDLNGWFYCLPRQRQALIPSLNAFTNEMHSALPCGCGGKSLPNSVSGAVQSRLLVFDQSGNQTSCYFGSPVQHHTSKKPKLFETYGSCREEKTCKFQLDMNYELMHVASDGLDENQETGEESEMHEDTEELDALLCSDDDDSDYDDEETSTGHYQGDFAEQEAQQIPEGSAEDVASSMGTTKRKRQLGEKQSIGYTATSGKRNVYLVRDYQDDADSSCVKGRGKTQEVEMNPLPSNKRVKREKIREAVRILQSIVPGGKGKDAMFVLDEAIRYLRSMKALS